MSKLARDHRNADLISIQIGRKQLALTDEDYRTILRAQGGVSSSRDLDHDGRQKVLAHFARLGFKPKKKPFGQAEKIAWLWRKLGTAGAIRDASTPALMAFVGRTAGLEVSHLKFLPVAEASKVIEALKAMLNRADKQK
ncbi:hypothetical protein BH10PSE18_BH10PSE18_18640 [soil metagenome]